MASKSERHFCGFSCYGAWQKRHRIGVGRKRVAVSCHMCGKPFERHPSAVNERNFCGPECLSVWRSSSGKCGADSPTWRGGHSCYRGDNWNRQRKAARERDNHTCQHCGKVGRNLPVHHVRPFRLFTDYREANRLENLITLCSVCHGVAEITFWREHPELPEYRQFPPTTPIRTCVECGEEYQPRSPATKICDACCNITCEHCGTIFFSRRAIQRAVKYCSRDCRNKAIQRKPQTCVACGKDFTADRPGVKFCSLNCHLVKANPRRRFSEERKRAAQE